MPARPAHRGDGDHPHRDRRRRRPGRHARRLWSSTTRRVGGVPGRARLPAPRPPWSRRPSHAPAAHDPCRGGAAAPRPTTSTGALGSPVEWRNWSGLESATRAGGAPVRHRGLVEAVGKARADGTTVKMVGTGHSFTAIAAPEHTLLTPGPADRDRRRRPGRDDRDRAGRHPAARSSTPSSSGSACPCTTWATSPSRPSPAPSRPAPTAPAASRPGCPRRSPAWSWSPAPARCCGPPPTRTPTSSTWPGSAWARSACSPRSRSGSSRCSCSRRTSSRCAGTRRSASYDETTADHHHVDMYWFPHTDRMLTKRNDRLDATSTRPSRSPAGGPGSTTSSCPTRCSARSPRAPTGSRP